MKRARTVGCMFLLLTLHAFPGLSATSKPPKDPALTIRGVGLGSAPEAIRKNLGKPSAQVVHPDDSDMGMGKLMDLGYSGLTFELCQPPGANDFHVWRFTVTSPTYVVEPGLKVGMSRDAAVRVLGEPASSEVDPRTGMETLHYGFAAFDGWYWVAVAKGRVAEISAAEDWS